MTGHLFAGQKSFYRYITYPNSIPGAFAASISESTMFIASHLEVSGNYYITLSLNAKFTGSVSGSYGDVLSSTSEYAF